LEADVLDGPTTGTEEFVNGDEVVAGIPLEVLRLTGVEDSVTSNDAVGPVVNIGFVEPVGPIFGDDVELVTG
jgi:hypothetical protein